MPLNEEVRQAATMKVGISTYVATAALAVMAGTLVIYTFVTSSFQVAWLFHALIFLGLLLLVLSVFIGGWESGRITDALADSNWDPKDAKKGKFGGRFSQQAMLTLAGLVVVTLATVTGVGAEAIGRKRLANGGSWFRLAVCGTTAVQHRCGLPSHQVRLRGLTRRGRSHPEFREVESERARVLLVVGVQRWSPALRVRRPANCPAAHAGTDPLPGPSGRRHSSA